MEIQVFKIEQLNEPTYADPKLYLKKVNKVRKIFGNATWHIAIDNTFMAERLLYMKQGGEYRRLPYKLPKQGFCDFHNDDKNFYPDLAAHSDFEVPFQCPQQPRTYGFRAFAPSLENLPSLIVQSGEYSCELIVEKKGKIYLRSKTYVLN